MSFLNKIGGLAKTAYGFLRGDGIGSTLARTALLGFALKKVIDSTNKSNENQQQDPGTEVQLDPDTEYSVPVLYGSAFIDGKVTDAHLASDNKTMWLCLTLCEKTGNLIDGTPSTISFDELYIDNFRISFQNNGYTVDKIFDDSGNSSDVWSGLIEVYPFNNGSSNPVSFTSEANGNTTLAYNLMPSWTSTDTMNELVFCLIKLTYNKRKKLTTVGRNIKFKLTNTMTKPGDVMNDYLQNTRYGAGIPAAEIDIS